MIHNKSVTILLAAYRGAAYAGAQIESVLSQDSDDWFLILSDDGEETAEVLEHYAKRYPEKIMHHRSGKRFGSAQKHFMYLLAEFGGEAPYTMFADQDDVWHADKLSRTLAAMKKAEDGSGQPLLVHTDLRVVDESLKEIAPSFMSFSRIDGNRKAFHELIVQNTVTGCTMMINRPLVDIVQRAAAESDMMMHDWWAALCAAAFGKIIYLPEATMDYRQHGSNTVGAKKAGSLRYMLSRLGQNARKLRDDTIRQTNAFLRLYENELGEKEKETARAFAGMSGQSKWRRLRTMASHHFWKNTLTRRAGQIIFW